MRILGRIALVIFGVLTSVLITEGLLRIIWHPVFLDSRFRRDDLEWTRRNVVLNRFGYRDRDFSLVKNKTTYRVYVVGDSYTFGWYLNNSLDAYPKVLEKLLDGKYGKDKFEIINAARPGFNPSEEINRVKQEGFMFSPDMILMGINFFDFMSGNFIYTPKDSFPENLYVYQATIGNFRRQQAGVKMEQQVASSYKEDSVEMLKFTSEIESVKRALNASEQEFVIIVFSDLDPANPNLGIRHPAYEEALKRVSEKTNVKMIFLSKYFNEVEDKTKLVLNPTDPHPSAFADKLVGEALFKELGFGLQPAARVFPRMKSAKLTLGAKLDDYKSILSVVPENWVYFDWAYGDGVEQLFLPDINSAKTTYLEDILKTAKLGRHEGWVGAKIEYNVPVASTKEFIIPRKVYGFDVVGTSQITVFWKEDGALHSKAIDLNETEIVRDNENIDFKIDTKTGRPIELVKLVLDVAASQFDINERKVIKMARTEILRGEKPNKDDKILGLAKYVWCQNKLELGSTCHDGFVPEFPAMVEVTDPGSQTIWYQ